MPLLITDGTIAREQHTGVIFHEGKITSGTSHVDLRWDQARSAGYGYFTLDLSGPMCLLGNSFFSIILGTSN